MCHKFIEIVKYIKVIFCEGGYYCRLIVEAEMVLVIGRLVITEPSSY